MRKLKLILSCLFLGIMLCGCSKDSVDTFADISNGQDSIAVGKGQKITYNQAYEYIRENGNDEIAKNLLKSILEDQLDFENQDISDLYKKYLNEYFETTFVNNDTYKYYGEFNEEEVVSYLSQNYTINCGQEYNSGVLDSTYFTCDYSDYIEKELNYDIYLKMVKVKYIIDERSNLIDRSYGRKIDYYSISRSSSTDYETREKLEGFVNSIKENYASADETIIRNINDIAELNRKDDLTKIKEEFEKISIDDSSFTKLNKYTTCGDKACSTIEEGKAYQENLVMEKDYYISKVVVKNNEDVLYAAARDVLFSDSLSEYLYKIGDKNYLMSPAYGSQENKNINDIILFDNSSTYYIATVDVIDSNSSFADKVLVAEMLIESVSDNDIFAYCFDKSDIKIHDAEINKYFKNTYGEY